MSEHRPYSSSLWVVGGGILLAGLTVNFGDPEALHWPIRGAGIVLGPLAIARVILLLISRGLKPDEKFDPSAQIIAGEILWSFRAALLGLLATWVGVSLFREDIVHLTIALVGGMLALVYYAWKVHEADGTWFDVGSTVAFAVSVALVGGTQNGTGLAIAQVAIVVALIARWVRDTL